MGGFSGTLGTLAIEIIGKMGQFEASMEDLSRETEAAVKDVKDRFGGLENLGQGLRNAGAGLTAALTVPILGIGYAATDAASEFESAMNVIQAQGGIVGADLDALREQALQLGATTQFSANEAAAAMGVLAASGRSATEIMAQMPGVLDLAAAGTMEVAEAARISTALLNQFQQGADQAGKASDLLAAASAACSANVGDFGSAMSYAGGIAHSAGLAMDETAAAMVLMNKQGLEGSKMGTGLRNVISALINPTTDAAEALEQLGIKTKNSAGHMLPLVDIVAQAEKSTMDTAQAFQIFGEQGATAFLALKNEGSAALRTVTTELGNSEGAAAKMAATLRQGLKGAIEEMKGSIETAAITLGTELLPYIQDLVEWGTRMVQEFVIPAVQWFGSLNEPMKTLLLTVAGLAAAIGPLLFVLGGAASAFVSISTAVATLAGPTALGGLTAMMGPLGIAIGGIAAAFALWHLLEVTGQVDGLTQAWNECWAELKEAWTAVSDLGSVLMQLSAAVLFMDLNTKSLKQTLGEVFGEMIKNNLAVIRGLAEAIGWLADKLVLVRNLFPGVKTGLADVSTAIKQQSTYTQGLMALYGDLATATGKTTTETKKNTTATNTNAGAHGAAGESAKKHAAEQTKLGGELKRTTSGLDILNARAAILQSNYQKLVNETAKITEDLKKNGQQALITEESFKAFNDEMSVSIAKANQLSTKELVTLKGGMEGVKKATQETDDAFKRLGITSTAELERIASQALKDYNTIKNSGVATPGDIEAAWKRANEAIEAASRDHSTELEGTFKGLANSVSTVITNFAQDISKSLWDGDMSWGEKGKKLLKSLGEAVTSSFVEPATKVLTTFITGVLADLLSGKGFGGLLDTLKNIGDSITGIFKSTGGGGIPGVGGGGGGGGGIAGGIMKGALGWASLATDVFGAVMGFIGDMRLEGTMNQVERNTAAGSIHLEYILETLNTHLPLMWFARDTATQLASLIEGLSSSSSYGGRTAAATEALLAHSQLAWARQAEQMETVVAAAAAMMSGSKAIAVTLVGTDPTAVGANLATKLQLQGGMA